MSCQSTQVYATSTSLGVSWIQNKEQPACFRANFWCPCEERLLATSSDRTPPPHLQREGKQRTHDMSSSTSLVATVVAPPTTNIRHTSIRTPSELCVSKYQPAQLSLRFVSAIGAREVGSPKATPCRSVTPAILTSFRLGVWSLLGVSTVISSSSPVGVAWDVTLDAPSPSLFAVVDLRLNSATLPLLLSLVLSHIHSFLGVCIPEALS